MPSEISATYGNVATATIGAVQRALLVLEQQGGENFFGEQALKISRSDAHRRPMAAASSRCWPPTS